ncbi:MAG: hypothetical protein EBT71_00820, partial [Alphaproteobacteria bacterium]|nr:hypothetical protein [Alphaproteobacteria bacterium]
MKPVDKPWRAKESDFSSPAWHAEPTVGYQLMFDRDVELRVDGTWSKEVRALTAADARETLLISLGKEVSGEALIAADVNRDGKVDTFDARQILLMARGAETQTKMVDWVFVDSQADLSGVTRTSVKEGDQWEQGVKT